MVAGTEFVSFSQAVKFVRTRTVSGIEWYFSSQLADIFNISFSTGVFPTILKVAKVVPVYKRTFQTIGQLYYWKDIKKINVQQSLHFFTKSNLIYPLQFGFRQHNSTFQA